MEHGKQYFRIPNHSLPMQIENAISCLWLAESTEVKLQIHKLTVLTEKIHV